MSGRAERQRQRQRRGPEPLRHGALAGVRVLDEFDGRYSVELHLVAGAVALRLLAADRPTRTRDARGDGA